MATFVGIASIATTQKAFAYDATGQVWNGSAFSAYASGNYATYKITATEGVPGRYYATLPAGTVRWELATDGLVAAHAANVNWEDTTALPNAAADAAGGLITNGDQSGQLSLTNGKVTLGDTTHGGPAATLSLDSFSAVTGYCGSISVPAGSINASFVGDLTGNISGNVSGNVTGNVDGTVGSVNGGIGGSLAGSVVGRVIGAALTAGTVSSTTGTTTTLGTGVATTSYYVSARLVLLAGVGAGQERTITAYTSGRVATHEAWATNPNASTTYEIQPARADATSSASTAAIAAAVRDISNASPAAGSIGAGINAIQSQTDLISTGNLVILAPYADGSLTIRKGDSYGTTSGQTIAVSKPSGAQWPDLTDGWTVTLTAAIDVDNASSGTATLSKTCVIVDATNVRVDLLASDTTALAIGAWTWELSAAKTTLRNTLIAGAMRVLPELGTA